MLDEYLLGRVRRISPEAPIPIVEVVESHATAGGAANVARNLIALGAQALLCGVCGVDAAGQRLRGALKEEGIADHLIEDQRRPTTIKTRIIAHQQQMVRFDREETSTVTGRTSRVLLQTILELITNVDVVIISDYAKGVVSPAVARAVIAAAQAAGKRVLVDPKGRDYSKYRGATLVTPNLSEAATAVGREISEEVELQAAMRTLLRRLRADAVVVTQGEHGLSLLESDGAYIHLPTFAREVHDGTGAGDTTVATTALAIAAGAPFRTAVALANYAAGVVVGKLGTSVVTPKELLDALPASN